MDLKSTYNKIAEDWKKDHDKDTWWQEGTDMFLSLLPRGSSVLDIGCGGGIKSKYITDKGYVVTGIDFSEKMIEIAEREYPGINFAVSDVYQLEKYPKKFDAVFAQAVLLHIPKNRVMEVLEKMKSCLNDGGLLYLGVKQVKEDGVGERVIKENDYGYDYERFFSFFTLAELEGYLKDLNMDVVWKTSTTSGKAGWLQIVGKKK